MIKDKIELAYTLFLLTLVHFFSFIKKVFLVNCFDTIIENLKKNIVSLCDKHISKRIKMALFKNK